MSSKKPITAHTLTAIVLFFMILAGLTGCIAGNYGKLQPNPEVSQEFKNYQVLPDHKYFYRGTSNTPVAMVGINPKYELNLSLWVPIDPQSDQFRTIINRIPLVISGSIADVWGFNILDQNGNVIGVWYSASRDATIKVNANNQIEMLSPMPIAAIGPQPDGP